MSEPHPRPARRVRDREALARARLALRFTCAACRRRPGSVHHVIPRGEGGDDDPRNLVPLCGDGVTGCHGALHGNSYVDSTGDRWTADIVRAAVGRYLTAGNRDTIRYVNEKLGPEAGRDYLRRHYGLDLEAE